jgi:nucleoside-diphosphate-sugar epimerase
MNVLVTGAQGFIGSHVTRLLAAAGHEVTRFTGDIRGNLDHGESAFEVIVHLASLISHRRAYTEAELAEVNIEGTRNLLRKYSGSHFVFVSTTDVERAILTSYAQTKREAEILVQQLPSHCVVRLPSVFGPGQRQASKLIPILLRYHILGGPPPKITDDVRAYVYVEAAAAAICATIFMRGLVSIRGTQVSNRDLNELVAAAARGDAVDSFPQERRQLLSDLRECTKAIRANPTEFGTQKL